MTRDGQVHIISCHKLNTVRTLLVLFTVHGLKLRAFVFNAEIAESQSTIPSLIWPIADFKATLFLTTILIINIKPRAAPIESPLANYVCSTLN